MKFPKVLSVILPFVLFITSFAAEKSNPVEEAWLSWIKNDKKAAEQKFREAIAADKNNIRAYVGLSYLYQLQFRDKEAWQVYKEIFSIEKNYYSYFFAAQYSNKVINNIEDSTSGITDLLNRLTLSGDQSGVLQAMARERLGEYYKGHNDLQKSAAYYNSIGAIKDWTVAGPFDNISASGMDKVFPAELQYSDKTRYKGKDNVPVKWFQIPKARTDGWIDFTRYFAYTDAVFYANTFIYSPEKRTVQIRVGTSGAVKVFLNDEAIISMEDENNNDIDTYIAETQLQKGWNRMLVKCGYSEIERCNFLARITEQDGKPADGLKYSVMNENYTSKPGAEVKIIRNFAESFFEEKIKQNPDYPENYLLLADCYLRNDKAIEAELILKKIIKKYPYCSLLYHQLLEAYIRGEKQDELETTFEKLYNLDPDIPSVLEHKYLQFMQNQDYDKAGEILDRLEKVIPGNPSLYALKINYYSQKKDIEKFLSTCREAYNKYPDNWTFNYTEAMLNMLTTKSYDKSIEIIKAYSEKRSDENVLTSLAEFYLNASKIDKWQETYDKLLEIDPSSTGYFYKVADTYIGLQNYTKAESYLQKTIDLCPNSSLYFERMGEVKKILKKEDEAKTYYRKALEFNPANYDAREKLRELLNKKSIFTKFESADINKLINESPSREQYQDENAIILLKDFKRVVYEEGTSETSEELLVKVFDADGIDDFKEHYLYYNPNIEDLIVEKAVVIKKDGSEIKADADDNYLVFKSLEENEFVYIKWKIRNMYSGKLSHHFWDDFNFNSFYPVKKSSYSLLVPESLKFRYAVQNMSIKPVIENKSEDGNMYRWEMDDIPAMAYEGAMPPVSDIGKILYISSIDSWEFFVDWYLDIALPKAKSSYEIKEKVNSLLPAESSFTEEEKIKKIYEYITENIQYSSVPFRQSGLIPQKARDVLVSRIGDCKDVATLCIAMLSEAGIKAHHVLVNTKEQGLNRNILPQISFNHCIVAVEKQNGKLLYLDLTAKNYPAGTVPEPDNNAFSLLIKKGTKSPFYLDQKNFLPRIIERNSTVTINGDNSVFITKSNIKSGSVGAGMRENFRFKSESDRLKDLTEVLTRDVGSVKNVKLNFEFSDPYAEDFKFYYEYTVPGYLNEAGGFKLLKLPFADIYEPLEQLSYEKREYNMLFYVGLDTLSEKMEIILPDGMKPVEAEADVKYSCAQADYSLKIVAEGNKLKTTRKIIYKKEFVTPDEYESFKTFYNNVLKSDSRQILLKSTI